MASLKYSYRDFTAVLATLLATSALHLCLSLPFFFLGTYFRLLFLLRTYIHCFYLQVSTSVLSTLRHTYLSCTYLSTSALTCLPLLLPHPRHPAAWKEYHVLAARMSLENIVAPEHRLEANYWDPVSPTRYIHATVPQLRRSQARALDRTAESRCLAFTTNTETNVRSIENLLQSLE